MEVNKLNHPLRYYLKPSWLIDFIRSKYRWHVRMEIYQWKMVLLMHIPGKTGSFFRRKLMGFKSCGENVYIGDHVWFRAPWNISIGDDCRIHPTCFLDGAGGIEIGSHVGLPSGTQIYSQNHRYQDKNVLYYQQEVDLAKVVIEDDVWVGAQSMILAGVTIKQGTIVAAGSVITKDTEPYSVVAGVPARKIGQRS
jgi:acetyltransferase-like isoleucine patch superfamily enzyme